MPRDFDPMQSSVQMNSNNGNTQHIYSDLDLQNTLQTT